MEEWGLKLDPEEVLARFQAWMKAPYSGIPEVLAGLRGRHTLACLSNTNALHWEKLLQMDGLRPVLELPFASHMLGLMKPGPEVFAHVVRGTGLCSRRDCLFLTTVRKTSPVRLRPGCRRT